MMNLPQPDLTSEGSATAANANRGLDAVRHFGQRLIWSTADPAAKPLLPTIFPGVFVFSVIIRELCLLKCDYTDQGMAARQRALDRGYRGSRPPQLRDQSLHRSDMTNEYIFSTQYAVRRSPP